MNKHVIDKWMEFQTIIARQNYLKSLSLDDRVLRLFSLACCREVWSFLDEHSKEAVEIAELYSDGLTTKEELNKAKDKVRMVSGWAVHYSCWVDTWNTNIAPYFTSYVTIHAENFNKNKQGAILASMCPINFSKRWINSTTKSLAQTIYDSKDFSIMPILADALQDVDCNEDVLIYLRSAGPFYKGNYIIDRLIGKR